MWKSENQCNDIMVRINDEYLLVIEKRYASRGMNDSLYLKKYGDYKSVCIHDGFYDAFARFGTREHIDEVKEIILEKCFLTVCFIFTNGKQKMIKINLETGEKESL